MKWKERTQTWLKRWTKSFRIWKTWKPKTIFCKQRKLNIKRSTSRVKRKTKSWMTLLKTLLCRMKSIKPLMHRCKKDCKLWSKRRSQLNQWPQKRLTGFPTIFLGSLISKRKSCKLKLPSLKKQMRIVRTPLRIWKKKEPKILKKLWSWKRWLRMLKACKLNPDQKKDLLLPQMKKFKNQS